ncbi:MAG: aminoacyl-tRNA hydrolase [Gemmataceae bacterium]|nr:aminoacyl-tRNA hydrolase [Gemmataceae bacterium]
MKVIVGLGNPGAKYHGARHNVGFAVVDYLAQSPRASGFRSRFSAEVAELTEDGARLLLVKPQTYMNLSGSSVRQVIDFFQVPLADLLIVCDDINLPLGKLRVRAKGSHGGHNGLRNIQEHLGTTEYARLRIGVGAPPQPGDEATVDHVLGRFRPHERPIVEEAIQKAALSALCWAKEGIERCMARTNAPEESGTKRSKAERDKPEPTPPGPAHPPERPEPKT